MKNYSPDLVIAVFKGVVLQGFAPGTMISADRSNDTFTTEAGAQGDVVRTRSADRRGRVVVTLQSASPTNALLGAFVAAGEEAEGLNLAVDVGALLIKDLNDTVLVSAEQAWIVRPAKVDKADSHQPREWTFEAAKLIIAGGGAIV